MLWSKNDNFKNNGKRTCSKFQTLITSKIDSLTFILYIFVEMLFFAYVMEVKFLTCFEYEISNLFERF